MATVIWKGSITFGLVSIPIRLYAAARPKRIAQHQLHNKCHTRLKQPLFCPTCNRIVERSEVIKGFEVSGPWATLEFLLTEDSVLDGIAPREGLLRGDKMRARVMTIVRGHKDGEGFA